MLPPNASNADRASERQAVLADAPAVGRRNLLATSATSFLTDLSSEMVLNLLPLFLVGPLGVRASVVGLIEGVAEATASLLKAGSGWWSDRLGTRKGLAVAGYGISSLAKPLLLLVTGWGGVAAVRWLDRVGKGVRTAPRDALLADSLPRARRGFGFGLHRAADSAGAVLGLGVAAAVVAWRQGAAQGLDAATFRWIVALSIVPAFLAVAVLAWGARDVVRARTKAPERVRLGSLGRPFFTFLAIAALFELGNAADAFIVLLADHRGLSVVAILGLLMTMNAVHALTSTWGGSLADRFGRRPLMVAGWSLYALVYLGFGLTTSGRSVWALAGVYGLYYGLTFGTARALVADLVPSSARGTAFGLFAAVLGVMDVPASVLAGVLWHGLGRWSGLGPSAPFLVGAALAAAAALALSFWKPQEPVASL